jgi:integrase/recombinase XerD
MRTTKKIIKLENIWHRNTNCIAMVFPYDTQLQTVVRSIPGAKFSRTHTCWYVAASAGIVGQIILAFKDKAWVDKSALKSELTSKANTTETLKPNLAVTRILRRKSIDENLNPDHVQALRMMEQKLKLKGYSSSTQRTYRQHYSEFAQFYNDIHPTDISELDIQNYLLFLVEQKKLSTSAQNQAINSIKFFYEKVLKQERKVYAIERPMKEFRLPEVLSQEEIMRIAEAPSNLKHKLILLLIYSSGLRRSELLKLRIGDVNTDRLVLFVRGGKGKKDRQVILAKSLVPLLKQYLEEYQPKFWFFEGMKGVQYSATSLQQIFKAAAKKAGIKKQVRLHMLRHSFATHLIENGTPTRYVQELLGHGSSKTTEIYTHVTRYGYEQLKSPLDHMVEQKHIRGD